MFHQLVSHNEDIERLIQKGYAVSFDSSYLIIRDIPYLNEKKELLVGAIVAKLDFVDKVHVRPVDHQIFFCGSHPCQLNGSLISNMGGGPATLALSSDDLVVQRSFSNKPAAGFANFFDTIESYVAIISGPPMELHNANPFTFRITEVMTDSVFHYNDTLTGRAEIGDLSMKLKEDIIAIIGLGGTGSYLLDFITKIPVKEIRGFDLDSFHVHNAFRSPGKLTVEELGKRKSEVYQGRYEGFRKNINLSSKFIVADSREDLEGVTFAFVCVDKGSSRTEIFDLLIAMKIPFIDVGMGLSRDNGLINGMLRMTFYDIDQAQEVLAKKLAPMVDLPDDVYQNNIQISELNALNACLAIIKYKQIRGFYTDDNTYYHMLLSLNDFHLAGE
ncbi:MAG: ThiF family adenylyltransferase [Bacteroidetes bacterium]|nr:ThiF family adenylyltransferase [Bacteroidota bacterium]